MATSKVDRITQLLMDIEVVGATIQQSHGQKIYVLLVQIFQRTVFGLLGQSCYLLFDGYYLGANKNWELKLNLIQQRRSSS